MRIALVPALLAVVAVPLAASDWIRIEPSVGMWSLSGDATYTKSSLIGTKAQMSDLGLDSNETVPAFEVDLALPIAIGLNVGGYKFSTDGSGTLTQNLNFGGITFAASTDVVSKADLQDVYAEINFRPPFIGRLDSFGLSLGLAAHSMKAKVSVAPAAGTEVAADKSVVFPALSARVYISPIDSLQIEGAAQFVSATVGDNSVTFLDAKAQLGYFPVQYLGVFAGYRMINLDVDIKPSSTEQIKADVSLSGPYVGLEARF